ncbi:MAG: cob(I)yrinic acid a,c-diamide adenosyltransferase [Betaproteobacteria bacterium]|nr:cob(I)yrinic acid a,c-diamide adenosyltransferase [Betaproteobacteria bacterium]
MGHRLSKIYTRTGDDGTTGLADGSRIGKDELRVAAMGTVDELNSCIGRVLAHEVPPEVRGCLERVQHDLFELGAELCQPGVAKIDESHAARLERELDAFNEPLSPLKEFILPGGTMVAADAHVARTVCRRAERTLVALDKQQAGGGGGRRYINRLSDLLFVIARVLNRAAGRTDVLWQPRKGP